MITWGYNVINRHKPPILFDGLCHPFIVLGMVYYCFSSISGQKGSLAAVGVIGPCNHGNYSHQLEYNPYNNGLECIVY